MNIRGSLYGDEGSLVPTWVELCSNFCQNLLFLLSPFSRSNEKFPLAKKGAVFAKATAENHLLLFPRDPAQFIKSQPAFHGWKQGSTLASNAPKLEIRRRFIELERRKLGRLPRPASFLSERALSSQPPTSERCEAGISTRDARTLGPRAEAAAAALSSRSFR